MASYDVIIIGSGPGGYVCAIRCAQLGLKTACVEGRETLGGTCLNVGCIPSKAMLHATHELHEANENFAKMGLKVKTNGVDWDQMQSYRRDTIEANVKGVEFLFKKNGVDWLKGWGSIPEPGRVKVGDETHEAKNIIIATGSEVAPLKGVEIDEKIVVSSTGALELGKIPKRMVVIGGGYIGLEMGSVYARLGTEVTVIEYLDTIVPAMDGEVRRQFQKILGKQGINFILNAAVQGVETTKIKAKVTYAPRDGDGEEVVEADIVLVSTGRRPYTDGLGLDELGIETERGMISTDDRFATAVDGIYAIGDATSGPMLAHKAEDEGMAVAGIIAGNSGHVDYDLVPAVVYTHPEVATVGKTEEALKEAGTQYKKGSFQFRGNGRARANFAAEGFVKILADKETDRILGAHIIGPAAGDLIHEIVVGMEFGAAAEDLALTSHAHPTYSEAVREAALACGDGAIHS